MLGHFPPLHPDELLYSVLARYSARLTVHSTKQLGKTALGRTTATAIVDLPIHLFDLTASIPASFGITADRLINEHTLWPYFAAFLDPHRRASTREEMEQNGHAYLRLGLMASRAVWPRFLRMCPICLEEDHQKFGEAFWHRSHQIPGVEICHLHRTWLLDSTAPLRHARNRHAYYTADCSPGQPIQIAAAASDVQLALALDAAWLLNHPENFLALEQLRAALLHQFTLSGYANWNGRLHSSKLRRDFAAKYPANWLASIGCAFSDTQETWMERVLRKSRGGQNPIRYILLSHFIGSSISESVNLRLPHPFGAAPWPCLNRAADHFAQPTVPDCRVASAVNGRRLTGRFSCPLCGMTYERTGPDEHDDDRMRRERIPCYGQLWDGALSHLWLDSSVSLRELSRVLGVDPLTAKYQAARLGLPAERSGYRNGTQVDVSTHTHRGPKKNVDSYKAQWLRFYHENPTATRTILRKAQPATYSFLRRHAAKWLEENSPRPVLPRLVRLRVDWKARDVVLSKKVKAAAAILTSRKRPVRLTRTALLREADCLWAFPRKAELLPSTCAALKANTEDRVTFALRRVRAASELSNGPLPKWKLLRNAGLRPDLAHDADIQRAVEIVSSEKCVNRNKIQARQLAFAAGA